MFQRESKFKDTLVNLLGTAGYVLWFLISGVFTVLPFVMIDVSWWVTIILIVAYVLIPAIIPIIPVEFGFWIWGFVCAVSGPQGFLTVLYYIAFGMKYVLPFVFTIISATFNP